MFLLQQVSHRSNQQNNPPAILLSLQQVFRLKSLLYLQLTNPQRHPQKTQLGFQPKPQRTAHHQVLVIHQVVIQRPSQAQHQLHLHQATQRQGPPICQLAIQLVNLPLLQVQLPAKTQVATQVTNPPSYLQFCHRAVQVPCLLPLQVMDLVKVSLLIPPEHPVMDQLQVLCQVACQVLGQVLTTPQVLELLTPQLANRQVIAQLNT